MRKLWVYLSFILIITIVLPTILVKTFNIVSKEGYEKSNSKREKKVDDKTGEKFDGYINIYDTRSQKTITVPLEDYVKGVVAAEMPAEFEIEALKAQAIASRTYALQRTIYFEEGHPDHPDAPLCTGIHCQAYLSLDELEKIHSKKWVEKYWGKIEEAVDETIDEIIYFGDEIIEPLYHSTSGGVTEDSENVFAIERPYLKSVPSPYEEEAPKFKSIVTMTVDEFIQKIQGKYSGANITKDNVHEKIKLVERTDSGRIKKIMVDGTVIEGREMRELFELNSTNFKIILNPKSNIVEIETTGYGHGVGMSQWGANGLAKKGKDYKEILKHYYTGVEIRKQK